MWINRYSNITDGTAFGGYKNSGIGREFCKETLNAYTQIKPSRCRRICPRPGLQNKDKTGTGMSRRRPLQEIWLPI